MTVFHNELKTLFTAEKQKNYESLLQAASSTNADRSVVADRFAAIAHLITDKRALNLIAECESGPPRGYNNIYYYYYYYYYILLL